MVGKDPKHFTLNFGRSIGMDLLCAQIEATRMDDETTCGELLPLIVTAIEIAQTEDATQLLICMILTFSADNAKVGPERMHRGKHACRATIERKSG